MKRTASQALTENTIAAFALLAKVRDGLEAVEAINDRDAEDINWGHVGDMAHIVEQLQPIADALWFEGEHAPETAGQRADLADRQAALEVLADVRSCEA